MNQSPNDQNHPVDNLVREYLLADAKNVDVEAMMARIKAQSQFTTVPRRSWGRALTYIAGLAIAASVAVLLLIAVPTTKVASAAELITAAQHAHETPLDRCYQLTIEIETGAARLLDLPPIVRKSNIWTRGDQFYLVTTPPNPLWPPLIWGQDANGRVWAVMNPRTGLLFEPDEINEPIANACNMMSLRTVTMLRELLTDDYQLSKHDHRIEAIFRPERSGPGPKLREVMLDLDPKTNEIRKAMIKRVIPAPIAGTHHITLTFELLQSSSLSDDQYTLAGHLDKNANILDRREPDRKMRIQFREEMMKRFSERILK